MDTRNLIVIFGIIFVLTIYAMHCMAPPPPEEKKSPFKDKSDQKADRFNRSSRERDESSPLVMQCIDEGHPQSASLFDGNDEFLQEVEPNNFAEKPLKNTNTKKAPMPPSPDVPDVIDLADYRI